MGRPRKDQPESVNPAVDDREPEVPCAEPESKPENKVELKACPVCGSDAEVFKDRNGLYRCACKSCHFWDSVPSLDSLTAAKKWNEAGGPNPIE